MPTRPRGSRRPDRGQAIREDERLFGALFERFSAFSDACFRFSQEIRALTGADSEETVDEMLERSLSITRRVFGGRLLEILAVLSLKQTVGFEDLKHLLGGFSSEELSEKLAILTFVGLVQAENALERAEETRYSLTHKGMIIARLGEPVYLYLRLAEGWNLPAEGEEVQSPETAQA
jgi:DNA-binding HxlR family transcriptional regulator